MSEHQCHYTTPHPVHDWAPLVPDPQHERVLHLGLATLRCPGIPHAERISTMDLPGFLRTRFTEDEALVATDRLDGLIGQTWHHWVVAELASKRQVLALHQYDDLDDGKHCCSECDFGGYSRTWCATLRALAVPYAGHVDYLEEWRP